MSRSLGVADRIPSDAYFTPDHVAAQCIGAIPWNPYKTEPRIIEPSIGAGAFARAIRKVQPRAFIYGIDIGAESAGFQHTDAHHVGNFMDADLPADWIIGNPPYRQAEAHIRHALECAPQVAFLLRLAFLESVKRAPFWREHPAASVHVFSKRPSFTGGTTDSAAYGFFQWNRAHTGPTTLHHIAPEAP